MSVNLLDREVSNDNDKYRYLKRNYILNTADGAVFTLAMGMVPLNTVLIYFISDFVSQKWLIGMLSCLNILLMFSPQVLVSKKLEQLRYYKPFLIFTSVLLRVLWLLMGLDVILFARSNPVLFTVLFYIFYSLNGLFSAFSGITWLNFIVKIIPGEFRGKFFGIRATICGIFESTGSLLMGVLVKKFPYPANYAILFITVGVLTFISLAFLSGVKEFESRKDITESKDGSLISRMSYVLKNDNNFTLYLVSVALIGGLGKMIFAFQIVFAKDKLGITGTEVSYATFILLACQTLGYLIWGILGDKYGFKLTLVISAIIFIPSIILTFLMSDLLIFYLSIGLFGVAQSARNVNENNLAINLCRNEDNQPLYIGLRNLLMGPFFAFSPVLAGVIYDFLGPVTLFVLSTVFMLGGLYVLLGHVKENFD